MTVDWKKKKITDLLRHAEYTKKKKIRIYLTYTDLEGLSHKKSNLQTKICSVLSSL